MRSSQYCVEGCRDSSPSRLLIALVLALTDSRGLLINGVRRGNDAVAVVSFRSMCDMPLGGLMMFEDPCFDAKW